MTPAVLFGVAIVSLAIAHLAATATRVLRDIAWHELEVRSRENKARFDIIRDEWEDVATGTETILYLAIAAHVLCLIAWASLSHVVNEFTLFNLSLGVTVGTFVLLATIVWFPNAIAEHGGTSFLYRSWNFWYGLTRVLRPLTWGSGPADLVMRRILNVTEEESEEEALEEEIRTIVAEGEHEGWLDSDTRDMIEGVIELDDANVADILTPRDKMDVMSVSLSWDEVLTYVTEVGRTRIPVHNGSANEFLGILYVKDLFTELRKPEPDRRRLQDILRPTWDVPTSLHLDELLQRFKQTRNHLALVVDEYKTIAGLVTIEDVLEEIVGEIVDESDKEAPGEIRVIAHNVAEVVGRAHVEDINEELGCDLPENEEFDTVGGFLMHRLGHIPKQGETLHWKDVLLTVVEASGRRAELVRIASISEDG